MKSIIALMSALILKSINPSIFPEWGWTIFWIFFALEVIIETIATALKD